MKMLCECTSLACRKVIEIDDDEVEALFLNPPRPVLIATDCATGPEPTDRLIDQRDGYALYSE